MSEIDRVHQPDYAQKIIDSPPNDGIEWLDGDTALSGGTVNAALLAAGAACQAVELVCAGNNNFAFCAIRPPGHHAEPDRAMGFCLFNNVMIGAAHAIALGLAQRVAIVDFDVHHGNGTQKMAWERPDIAYVSVHQSPLFPGTGLETERGDWNNILNCPLPSQSKGETINQVMTDQIIPFLTHFKPDLLMISAGFDGHARDPLAGWHLDGSDYYRMTEQLHHFAASFCSGRIVSVLEGGYDLDGLADGVANHWKAFAPG